jgi:DNA-binding SARP family transcriptional activator
MRFIVASYVPDRPVRSTWPTIRHAGCEAAVRGLQTVAAAMDFRILGPLEVDDDGRPVELGGARQRALLTLLLLRRGEVVAVDQLIEGLYGGRPPPSAAKSLQAHVSRLRKALPGGRLHTRGPGYLLQVAPEEVDADRFSRRCESGRSALRTGDVELAERDLSEALALWRGPALADMVYEEFAQPEIARLEELRLACFEDLTEARLAAGRDGELVSELERLVDEHPTRERLRGQLMLALYRCGRQADALASYQEARRALVDELGIEPGRVLQDLERAILNQDPSLDAVVRPDPTAAGPSERSDHGGSFIGRARELAQLEELLQQTVAGNGGFALVSGEAGIGKSRLVEELAVQARRRGMLVLPGRSWEAGGAPAFWPWVQAFRAYVRDLSLDVLREQLGGGASDVAYLLPELRDVFPDIPEAQSPESEGARFRLFDSTVAFLRRAAAEQPIVVTLDDLHAADPSSLLLLSFVAGQLDGARAAVVATYRDPELEADDPVWIALLELVRHARIRISLRGLGEAEVGAYIHQVTEETPAGPFVAAIAAETDGNPLFVGEIVRLLATEGTLPVPSSADWRPQIPETVLEVIERRLQRLSAACRDALTIGSVIGRDFSLTVLERLTTVPRDLLVDQLDEAVAARMVTIVPGSRSDFRFTHALVRDALYDELAAGERRDLHRRAAEAISAGLGSVPGTQLSELAHHYLQALPSVDPDLAVEAAQRAGDHAREIAAFEEAARLYETALQALSFRPAPAPEIERRVLLSLGQAYAGSGDTATAKDAFLRAAVLSRESGAPDDLAAAALGYGGPLVWARPAGDPLVVPLLEEALAVVPADESALRARLLARLAGALRDELDPRRRLEVAGLAVEAARSSGDTTALVQALLAMSVSQYSSDDHESRLRVLQELREHALQTDDAWATLEVLNAEIVLSSAVNDFAAVAAHARRLSERAEELRRPSARWFAGAVKTLLALHYGDFDDAERLVVETFELGRHAYPTEARSAYVAHLYLLRREQGRAAEVYDALVETAAANPARPFFRAALSALAVDTGRMAHVRRLVEELAPNRFGIVPRDSEWPLAAAFLVESIQALGDATHAAVLYEELTPLAERSSANPPEGSIGAIARSLGILAGVLRRRTDAVAHLRRAIEIDTATGARPWVAYAQLELAELLRADDPEEAASLLVAATATAEALAMARLARRIAGARS